MIFKNFIYAVRGDLRRIDELLDHPENLMTSELALWS